MNEFSGDRKQALNEYTITDKHRLIPSAFFDRLVKQREKTWAGISVLLSHYTTIEMKEETNAELMKTVYKI